MTANETLALHLRILVFIRRFDDFFESKKTSIYMRVYNYNPSS